MKPFQLLIGLVACIGIMLAACTPSVPETDTSTTVVVAESSSDSSEEAMIPTSSATSSKAMTTSSAHSVEAKTTPKTDAEWKAVLTADQYAVLREGGTEQPFTSLLLHEKRKGTYVTADCGTPVFRSEQKFDSGTGWPSFWAPIKPGVVMEQTDTTLGMQRTEVLSTCGGHLGHVFTDGPEPTGLRYCMNGLALKFIPDEGE